MIFIIIILIHVFDVHFRMKYTYIRMIEYTERKNMSGLRYFSYPQSGNRYFPDSSRKFSWLKKNKENFLGSHAYFPELGKFLTWVRKMAISWFRILQLPQTTHNFSHRVSKSAAVITEKKIYLSQEIFVWIYSKK